MLFSNSRPVLVFYMGYLIVSSLVPSTFYTYGLVFVFVFN